MNRIILASQSPRRKELLEKMGFQFEIIKPDYEELIPKGVTIDNIPEYHSIEKAKIVAKSNTEALIIASDTVVICNDTLLEKPNDINQAKWMLGQLSNNTHQVITGYALIFGDKLISGKDICNVSFKEISENEIDYYVNNYSVLDKAGAYGAQDWIGLNKISRLEGSYFTVMGLPTHLIYREIFHYFPSFLSSKFQNQYD